MKKVRELKSWIEGYEQVTSAVGDLQVLFDFAKEGEATEEEVDAQYQETIRVLEDIEMRKLPPQTHLSTPSPILHHSG